MHVCVTHGIHTHTLQNNSGALYEYFHIVQIRELWPRDAPGGTLGFPPGSLPLTPLLLLRAVHFLAEAACVQTFQIKK